MQFQNSAQFYKYVQQKEITVIGLGISNAPLVELLCQKGAKVTVRDKRTADQIGPIVQQLSSLGVKFVFGEEYMTAVGGDMIIKTPGMRYDHPALLAAEAAGSVVTSEMELFFEMCPCQTIAVTGSDGKTTTTSLIAELLRQAGYTVHLGGNIGKPLLPEIDAIRSGDIAVLELSSFQLHTMRRSPSIAVVTNLAPNHLDMHKDMAEYIDAKANIFRYQGTNDTLVLNYDNDITRSFAQTAAGNVRWFSFRQSVENGVYQSEGAVYCKLDCGVQKILERKDILLRGDHNVENYMAAIAAVWDLVAPKDIIAVAKNFGGVRHRIEWVGEIDGISFYNDSIGSSPSRTVATLKSFEGKVHLIAGGYDKKIPFDALGEIAPKHIKALYLNGATAPAIRAAVEKSGADCPIYEASFDECVRLAYKNAMAGDVVLLSPACASFDQFKNFEERGDHFIEVVRALQE